MIRHTEPTTATLTRSHADSPMDGSHRGTVGPGAMLTLNLQFGLVDAARAIELHEGQRPGDAVRY
jgi:hypothetical protein